MNVRLYDPERYSILLIRMNILCCILLLRSINSLLVSTLTTQGNPPVATAHPIAASPIATAVAMTHFVAAKDGPPVATTKLVITGNIYLTQHRCQRGCFRWNWRAPCLRTLFWQRGSL